VMGTWPGHRGWGAVELRTGRRGRSKLGASSRVPSTQRKRRGSRRRSEAQRGAVCACEAGACCVIVHIREQGAMSAASRTGCMCESECGGWRRAARASRRAHLSRCPSASHALIFFELN
jgi:hypothetical protein